MSQYDIDLSTESYRLGPNLYNVAKKKVKDKIPTVSLPNAIESDTNEESSEESSHLGDYSKIG